MSNPLDTATDAIGDAVTADKEMQSKEEFRAAARILAGVALLVVLAVLITVIWGLPGLTMLALAATVVVMALLIAYAAGF